MENILVPLMLDRRKGYSFLSSLRQENGSIPPGRSRFWTKSESSIAAYRTASELAYGDKRLVEMAIVLARNPKLVMLDEPTAGMNPEETDRMILAHQRVGRPVSAPPFSLPNTT